ncbi:hypothetical protein [Telluribacter sp.]|jgi:hypothetical protein|uniref:hypothetical protein n=1 Tax=Telluribacter sp. TaxID=1978767 RepID=UPI002E0F1414|nr:hypothetical protein [Telluribacter sp.]
MKKILVYPLVVCLSLLIAVDALAQADSTGVSKLPVPNRRAKAIYVEALGSSGFFYSLNYDMRFKKGLDGLGFRIGITRPDPSGITMTYSGPILINYVTSARRIAFEAGAGVIVAHRRYEYEDHVSILHKYRRTTINDGVANVGIRVQPFRTGIIWRLYWAPTWIFGEPNSFFPQWLGTSLGIGFR